MDLAICTVLLLKQDLAYLKLTAFFHDFYASKLCFTVLPLVRTWLIHIVLPFKQDLAYLKLMASQFEKILPNHKYKSVY